jgi:ferredoxin-type protein NapF
LAELRWIPTDPLNVTDTISRAQFLRGDFSGRRAPLRPPWALPEAGFVARCDGCGECVAVCPTHILHRGRGGHPEVDFGAGECVFCGDCASVCRPGALSAAGGAPWSLTASIDGERCLAFRGVDCRSCWDPCEPRAIRMRARVGGPALPELDAATCTGCGACYGLCPVRAVSLRAER